VSKIIKIFIAAFIIISIYLYFDISQYLSLEYVKSQKDYFKNIYLNNTLIFITIYFSIYVISTALSIPGATILTLFAGFIFGTLWGTIIASFASTLGATFSMLISRYFFRSYLESKFSEKIKVINEGIEKEGNFYLFAMRLVPIFPFFVINLLFGLTKAKISNFFFISQIGMLAGTILYVYAGNRLSQIDSLNDIISIDFLLLFTAIGILPIITKKILEIIRNKKVKK